MRDGLKALGHRWDKVGRLFLATPNEINEADRCNLFCISKPDVELRQIIDRRPRNARERPPPSHAPKMGHPSTFLGIIIPPSHDLKGNLDDLRNFYHEFKVSDSRSLSTPVGPTWTLKEWEGTAAHKILISRLGGKKELKPTSPIYACFAGLSMGDHWAPALAQASHEELLRAHDALRAEEELRFGVIPPRAPLGHYTGVCIDDKLSMQLIPKSKPEMPLRDHDACANAAAAYDHAGLVVHEKKQVRRAEVFCAWGAEVEGVHGYCGAKRSRLAWLAVLTFKASRSRVLTRKLLDELVGCWAFCLQFRRPLFSLIELMYNEGPVSKGHTEPFRPSQALRAEMQVLALLGMTAMSQLRTQVGPTMYATDASPDGAGAVSSTVEPGLAREIARRAECRGFHTRLLPPISAHLHEKGFVVDESLISSDFDLGHTQPPLDAGDPAPLLHKTAMFPVTSKIASMHDLADCMRQASARPQKGIGLNLMFDFIEIYSGSAILSREMIGKGLLVGPPIDIKSGWNMRKGNLFSLILGLALAGRIAILWLGPPATTYTHDRTPKIRSSVAPLGFDIFHLDVLGGNLHMHMSILLMAVQYKKGRIGVLETPWSAFSRKLKFWGWLLSLGCCEIRIDQCQFGTPYLKSTCLIATHEFVRAMGRRCRGGHKHVDLKGAATATASKYPVGLCKALASCLTQGARELFAIPKSDGLWSSDDSLQHPQASPPPDQSRPRNLEYSRTSRKFVSHLWSVQLAEALVWKCCKKYTFKRQGDINLLEAHSRRSLLLNIPPRQRVITFQDSMVTLGAGAKGRSSSCALNKILKQEAMIQVAKELYVLGIHAPTWALRADDPSRGRSVRGPRAPFPLWWFKWMQGQVSEAQDLLDHASDTPRFLGRWFLLLSAAVLASSADFSSLRDWSQTLSMPSRQKRLRAGEGHPPNCHFTSSVVGGFSRMDPNSSARLARFEPAGQKPAGDFVRTGGGVRKDSLRAGCLAEDICRNSKCPSAEVCLSEDVAAWFLGPCDNLGEPMARTSSPTDAADAPESDGIHCACLGLEESELASFSRLLRFIKACRSMLDESDRFHDTCRHWCARHFDSSASPREESHQGRKVSERPARRATRDYFYQEVFCQHEPRRKAMALFGEPVSHEIPTSPPSHLSYS